MDYGLATYGHLNHHARLSGYEASNISGSWPWHFRSHNDISRVTTGLTTWSFL